jgi:glycosyltransferase involved in cell wall biosynthesis
MPDSMINASTNFELSPFVSVVVPFYNAKNTIISLLFSLLNQSYSPEKFEILLVDDGSEDDAVAELNKRLSGIKSPSVRILHNKRKKGPANARNKGILESKGDIVAFTDADTIPDVNWLKNLVAGFDSKNVVGVRGETTTDGYALFPVRIAPLDMKNGYKTCNMAYRKDALVRIGLFDENFRHPFGEDGDLAHRLLDSDLIIADMPTAKVLHPIKKRTLRQTIGDAMLRRYDVLFFRKHPKEARKYGERFMRPVLTVSRKIGLSITGISLFLYIGLIVTSLTFGFIQAFLFELLTLFVAIGLAVLFLSIFGYKKVATGIAPKCIPPSERVVCSIALVVYYFVTCLARLFGSLEFRVLMV